MTEKLLLVNPRHPERLMRMNIPLGLLYVGTSASHQGYQVNILDVNNYPNQRAFMERLEEELEGMFAVGLSVMTAQMERPSEGAAPPPSCPGRAFLPRKGGKIISGGTPAESGFGFC